MAVKEKTMGTMTVRLEDGTEGERPCVVRRRLARAESDGPNPSAVPFIYPGEEAVRVTGGWLIRRLRK